jgi:hypothetical protein
VPLEKSNFKGARRREEGENVEEERLGEQML